MLVKYFLEIRKLSMIDFRIIARKLR